MPTGNWSGCHAVGWDRNAPEFGDLAVGDNFQKHSYPFGHHDQRQRRALRRRGRRLPQLHLCQVRPRDPDAAGAVRLAGVRRQDHPDCCATSTASSRSPRSAPRRWRNWRRSSTTSTPNGAAKRSRPTTRRCAPTCRSIPTSRTGGGHDGPGGPEIELGQHHRHSRRSRPTRSPAASPSRSAASRSTPRAASSIPTATPIPGLYAAGELVGGLFYFNYPGGTGLMAGAVFGRIAGATAGRRAASNA